MLLQKCLASTVKLISWVFQMEEHYSNKGIKDCPWEEEYFSMVGPRILVIRKNESHQLTGAYAIKMKYSADGKLVSCRFVAFDIEACDRLVQEPYVYREYHKLTGLTTS